MSLKLVSYKLNTNLGHGYASGISAREFSIGARRIVAVNFIGAVSTVVLVVALPRFKDTPTVGTSEFVATARVVS